MKPIDMTSIYKKYRGLWVALKSSKERRVVASGSTLHSALSKARKLGYQDPLMVGIPKKVYPRVGLSDIMPAR